MLSATSLDITRLHPFVIICWYLAAVVQVQLCKYFIEIGDSERESTVWGEINVLRFAMLEFGSRSPIGIRQERLLQGLMKEIVRMTAQRQPLEVGVPLYPFSHATLFRKGEPNNRDEGDTSGNALLPTVSQDPQAQDSMGSPPIHPPLQHQSTMSNNGMSPPNHGSGRWSVHEASMSPQGTYQALS